MTFPLLVDNFELTGWAAFALLAFYMAISNILLVNLLVAMFSYVFIRVSAQPSIDVAMLLPHFQKHLRSHVLENGYALEISSIIRRDQVLMVGIRL